MREMLFRGKRPDGQWMYGYLSKSRDMSERPAVLKPCIDYEVDGVMYSDIVMPETVGQYTGKNDKDGRRIFDGDILKAGCSMLVVWDEKFASWCVVRKGWAYKHFFGEGLSEEDCEVIGNIHDNPELLEV